MQNLRHSGNLQRCLKAAAATLLAGFFCASAYAALPQNPPVVINEIMFHPLEPWPSNQPSKTTNRTEFIEIYNPGTNVVSLSDYRFDKGVNYEFPYGTVLPSDGYLVLCENRAAFTAAYPGVKTLIGEYSGSLDNGGERITLSRKVNGQWETVDTFEYVNGGPADGHGYSLELVHPGFAHLSRECHGSWEASAELKGTPGAINSRYSSDAPPVITEVRHDPPLPFPNSCVTISARVTAVNPEEPVEVRLLFRKDRNPPFPWSSALMKDTGHSGDLAPGDGIYSLALPRAEDPAMLDGEVLEFRIRATDIANKTSEEPVMNTAEGLTSGGAAYSYLCYFGDDVNFTGEYPTYHIVMTATNERSLSLTANQGWDGTDKRYDGTLISSDGQIFYNCGIRYRGSSTRSGDPYNFRIRFPAGEKLDGIYPGITFNYQAALSQYLGMKTFRKAGLQASDVLLCRLWLNQTVKHLGPRCNDQIYIRVEGTTDDFIPQHYEESSGNLYKGNKLGGSGQLSPFPTLEQYYPHYIARTTNPYRVWRDLDEMCKLIVTDDLVTNEISSALQAKINVRQWARHMAIHTVFNNQESCLASPNAARCDDYLIYNHPTTGFEFLPWDMDSLPNVAGGLWAYQSANHTWLRSVLFNQPTVGFFIADVLDIANNTLSDANLTEILDSMGSILTFDRRAGFLRTIQASRRNLTAAVFTNMTLSIVGPTVRTTSAQLDLTIRPPENGTYKVLVNNVPATPKPWKTSDMGRTFGYWQAPATLPSRVNPLTIRAVDYYGKTLASTTLTVIVEGASALKSGPLRISQQWENTRGALVVDGDVTVPAGLRLTVAGGTVVLVKAGKRIIVENGGTLDVAGTPAAPVYFAAYEAGRTWQILVSNAVARMQYARISDGRLIGAIGANVELLDSVISNQPHPDGMLTFTSAKRCFLNRCELRDFKKNTFTTTPLEVRSSLLERMSGCGLEILNGNETTQIVTRCTFRNSAPYAASGVSIKGEGSVILSSNLLHTLGGSAISVTTNSTRAGIVYNKRATVSHNVIAACGTGIDFSSNPVSNWNNTVVGCQIGLQGSQATCWNTIAWSNATALPNRSLPISWSNIELPDDEILPGTGNMNSTPWFVLAEPLDYRLMSGRSPCLTAGQNGQPMGAVYPVGASLPPPSSFSGTVELQRGPYAVLTWPEVPEAAGFTIERKIPGGDWQTLCSLQGNARTYQDTSVAPYSAYVYRLRSIRVGLYSLPSQEVLLTTSSGNSAQALRDFLRVTEIMYNPQTPGNGTFSSDDYEFIELKNIGTAPLSLTGTYLTNAVHFAFTNGTTLAAGAFLVLARNSAAFSQRYTKEPYGEYSGKLDNAGETLEIYALDSSLVLSLTYKDGSAPEWYPTTDGDDYSLVLAAPAGNPNDSSSWRASSQPGGSPGSDDPPSPYGSIVINEVLTHSDPPLEDAIELYNAGSAQVDIAGWYLSDSIHSLTKYRITNQTLVIKPGEYHVFYEGLTFNHDSNSPACFELNSAGETLYLSSGNQTGLTSYRTIAELGAAPNGTSFGRYRRSDGQIDYTFLSQRTFGTDVAAGDPPSALTTFRTGRGAPNAPPLIGPVVISEIMYNPSATGKEFVEIENAGNTRVPLFDTLWPTNTWRFDDGIRYAFPTNTWLNPGQRALVTSIAPDEFRALFRISDPETLVFGPFDGELANSGEAIRLVRADNPNPDGTLPWVCVDRVRYNDKLPWPVAADNEGASLEKISLLSYGNEPTNWIAASLGGTPGAANNPQGIPTIGFETVRASIMEGVASFTVYVTLQSPASSTVTVRYTIAAGTAQAGSDFMPATGTVKFRPYDTRKTIQIALLDDSRNLEDDETVIATLSDASVNARISGNRTFTLTLVDTDPATIAEPTLDPYISPTAARHFTNNIVIQISHPLTNTVLRYTLNGANPTQSDSLYTGPITLRQSARVKARAFLGSWHAGAVASGLYLMDQGGATWTPQTLSTNFVDVPIRNSASDASESARGSSVSLNATNINLGMQSVAGNYGYVGLRFERTGLPRGTIVSNAHLQLTAASSIAGTATVIIFAEKAISAAPFTTAINNISSRNRTTNTVSWAVPHWPIRDESDLPQRTPDISAIINEVLAQDGWTSEQPIVLCFKSTTTAGERRFQTYENSPARVARFRAEYTYAITNWLSVSLNAGGRVQGGNVWLRTGTPATITAEPLPLYRFRTWKGDLDPANDPRSLSASFTMTRNRSITAQFEPLKTSRGTTLLWLTNHFPNGNFEFYDNQDADGDGVPTWAEYIQGTDPTNEDSVIRIVRLDPAVGGLARLHWKSVTNRNYEIFWTTNLTQGWLSYASDLPGNRAGTNSFPMPTMGAKTFYRIR